MNAPQSQQKIPATLIPGDGIGPEITDAVVAILEAAGAPFDWDVQQGGISAIKDAGDPLPEALLQSIRRTRLALKGPLTTPVGGGFRSVNVRLREEFELYANVRPGRTVVPGGRYEDIDLVLIRENLEGLYVAFEHYVAIGDAACMMLDHVGRVELAQRIRVAVDQTLRADNIRTGDLGGSASTADYAAAVIRRLS